MRIPLNKSILFLTCLILIWTLANAVPTCEVLSDSSNKLFLVPEQKQVLSLSRFFQGYNLQYSKAVDSPSYDIVAPFQETDSQQIEALLIPPDFRMVAIDVLKSSETQSWNVQGSLLIVNQETDTIRVLFGSLNDKNNLNFNVSSPDIRFDSKTSCFDIVHLDIDTAFLDCQSDTDDVHVIVSPTSSNITKFPIFTAISDRTDLLYRDNGQLYILSSMLASASDPSAGTNNSISIYRFDSIMSSTELSLVVDASALEVGSLSISDIHVDLLNNIYVLDGVNGAVFRFKYSGSRRMILNSESFEFREGVKLASYLNANQQVILEVATLTGIYEIKWPLTFSPEIQRKYEVDFPINQIIDLQANNDVLSLETDQKYYIYKNGETKLNNLLYSTARENSLAFLDVTTPNVIIVGKTDSKSYRISQGYLIVSNIQSNQTIGVMATSQDTKQCQVQFDLTLVTDSTKIYTIREPDQTYSTEIGTQFNLDLDQYYIGQKIQYFTQAMPNVKYTRKHIEPYFFMEGVDVSYASRITTLQIDQNTYFRITNLYSNIVTFEQCVSPDGQGVKCTHTRSLTVPQGLFSSFEVFLANYNGQDIPIFAYVPKNDKNVVYFESMLNQRSIPPLVVDQDFQVTDIEANHEYIVVTLRDSATINIYKSDMKYYPLITTINQASFTPEHLQEIVLFKPRKVVLFTENHNPSVIFIKNLQSAIVMKISENIGSGATFVNNIKFTDTLDAQLQWDFFVTNTSLFVVLAQATDAILEYNIQDVYQPIYLKKLDLGGGAIALPITVASSVSHNFIFVLTKKQDDNYSVMAYRMNQPSLSSVVYQIPSTILSLPVTVFLNSRCYLQVFTPNQNVYLTFYSHPSIAVSSSIDVPDFKRDVKYGFTINTQAESASFVGSLTVFNYHSQINENVDKTKSLTFPFNASTNLIDFDVDSLFNGPVNRYAINCPFCLGKVTLIDHQKLLNNTLRTPTVHQYLYIKNLDAILVLMDTSVIMLSTDYQVLGPEFFFQVSSDSVCNTMAEWKNNLIVIFCQSSTTQFFYPISLISRGMIAPFTSFQIPKEFAVKQPYKLVTKQGHVFLLDNDRFAQGNGLVRVFKIFVSNDLNIVPKTTVDYTNFNLANRQPINDLDVFETGLADTALIVATLGNLGLGCATFNVSSDTLKIAGTTTDFNRLSAAQQYLVGPNNKFLQLVTIYSKSNSPNQYSLESILTVSQGLHLHIKLSYAISNQPSQTFLASVLFTKTYNRLGSHTVLNWAYALPFDVNSQNWLMIASYDSSIQKLLLGLYSLDVQAPGTTQFFKTSINQTTPYPSVHPGIVFRPNSTLSEMRLLVPVRRNLIVSNSTHELYNLSQKVYLTLNYAKAPDSDNMVVTAVNDYSTATHNIKVNFDGGPNNMTWLKYTLIGAAAILLIVVVYCVARKVIRRRTEEKKLSLIDEPEQQQV